MLEQNARILLPLSLFPSVWYPTAPLEWLFNKLVTNAIEKKKQLRDQREYHVANSASDQREIF